MHDAEPMRESEPLLETDGGQPAFDQGVELQPLDPHIGDDESESKLLSDDGLATPSSESSPKDDFIWTPAEERRVQLKLDAMVMPLLIVAFFALQLDRGNIGNALTDYFLEDVDISQTQFNNGQQLLALGIVLWEIPSNFVRLQSMRFPI